MVQLNQNLKPTANITVNKSRLKTYGKNVYLKDGTSFEIELYNPTRGKVLAVIEIDGRNISSSGIILNPGERVFLERWIDESKKFKFSTYKVENNEESKKAISENGRVKVNFHNEISHFTNFGTTTTWTYPTNGFDAPYFYGNSGTIVTASTTTNAYFSSPLSREIETGRSEKGESSNQDLISASGDFDMYVFESVNWKILPDSLKPIEASKIRKYCTECGTRTRSTSWKFCPTCGEKI